MLGALGRRLPQSRLRSWADLLVNIMFPDDPNHHVFELQIYHRDMLLVRQQLGGHREYDESRAGEEILSLMRRCLPSPCTMVSWSFSNDRLFCVADTGAPCDLICQSSGAFEAAKPRHFFMIAAVDHSLLLGQCDGFIRCT